MTDHVYTILLMLFLTLLGGAFAVMARGLDQREARKKNLRKQLMGEARGSAQQTPPPHSTLVENFQKLAPQIFQKPGRFMIISGVILGLFLMVSGVSFFVWGMCSAIYLLGWGVLGYWKWQWHQTCAVLQKQIPDALEAMARMGKVGITPEHMFARLAEEFPSPAQQIFIEVDQLLKIGVVMDLALSRAFARFPNRDLFYLRSVLLLHRRVGGNSARLLETLAQNVRERHGQEKQIKILTSEARSAAKVVGGLSLAAVLGLFFMNRTQFDFLLHHEKGHSLITYAVVSTALGFFVIHQMLRAIK